METFPKWLEKEYEKAKDNGPLSTLIFGNRFKSDQTLYEYLYKILYLIFDYPHKHYTFKHFEI